MFSRAAFPPPTRLNSTLNASDVLQIAYETLQAKPYNSMALVANDEAVGDPASEPCTFFEPALISALTLCCRHWHCRFISKLDSARPRGWESFLRSWSAACVFAWLRSPDTRGSHLAKNRPSPTLVRSNTIKTAPTDLDCCCHHRADFIYMGPPFIAYFGITQGGKGELPLLQAAYDQCRLYRDQLYDEDASLWRHIALGNWQDNNHWATGTYCDPGALDLSVDI